MRRVLCARFERRSVYGGYTLGTRYLDGRTTTGGEYHKLVVGNWVIDHKAYPQGVWVKTTDINPGFDSENGFETQRVTSLF